MLSLETRVPERPSTTSAIMRERERSRAMPASPTRSTMSPTSTSLGIFERSETVQQRPGRSPGTAPERGGISPASVRYTVDLPQPLSPTMLVTRPSSMRRSHSRTSGLSES